VGLFYRDLHWRFKRYQQAFPWHERFVAVLFHWYDWLQYRRLIDWLFLPSLRMGDALPTPWHSQRVSALPPGGRITDPLEAPVAPSPPLRLFYVGGVTPPLYDLRPLFRIVARTEGTELILCCRREEWARQRAHYPDLEESNVQIVHASGSALEKLYRTADLFALVWQPYDYLDFAMPVKLFEALGYALPILTLEGTEAARFVAQEDIGWVVRDLEESHRLLKHLVDHPAALVEKRQRCLTVRSRHRWVDRAQTVVDVLTSLSSD
jgi:hypothetical protein